jgi:hypothetical protein
MAWTRNEPDPLREKRRQLEEQERLLAERMAQLTQKLQEGDAPPGEAKAPEPPVWRLEEGSTAARLAPELTPSRRRNLGRQRQRDMFLFFLCIVLLLIATGIFYWLWETHLRVAPE